jgi:hypothetical protein
MKDSFSGGAFRRKPPRCAREAVRFISAAPCGPGCSGVGIPHLPSGLLCVPKSPRRFRSYEIPGFTEPCQLHDPHGSAAGDGGMRLDPQKHHTKMGAPPGRAVTPAPGSTPPPFAAQDKKFLNTAALIFAYERRLGSLARQYGNSDEARNLGSLMETEMALAEESLKALAVSKQQKIDAGAGWGHGGLERLASQRGGDFDRKFYEEVKLVQPRGLWRIRSGVSGGRRCRDKGVRQELVSRSAKLPPGSHQAGNATR